MKLLTRDAFFQSNYLKIEQVDVTEWGAIDPETGKPEPTFICVRELTAAENNRFERSVSTIKGKKTEFDQEKYLQKLAIAICCDENRNPIFNASDVESFSEKSITPLSRILVAHQRMSGRMDDEAFEVRLKN
jgi:carbamoylphosphate synthase large subunit